MITETVMHAGALLPLVHPHLQSVVALAQGASGNPWDDLWGVGDDFASSVQGHAIKVMVAIMTVGMVAWAFGFVKGRAIMVGAVVALVVGLWLAHSFTPTVQAKFGGTPAPAATAGP